MIKSIYRTGHKLAVVLPLAGLIMLGAGCSKKPEASVSPAAESAPAVESPAPDSAAEPEAGAEEAAEDSGAAAKTGNFCDHPYYPLSNSYAIKYSHKLPESEPFLYSLSAEEVTGKSAVLAFAFTEPVEFTSRQKLTCADGTVRALNHLDMAGDIGRLASGMSISTKTTGSDGPLMPPDPKVGDSWTNEFRFDTTIEGIPEAAGLGGMTSKATSTFTVLSEEKVTVPAGSYSALKISVKIVSQATLASGQTTPASELLQTQWWVRNVGMVKMTADMPSGQSVTEAIEISL